MHHVSCPYGKDTSAEALVETTRPGYVDRLFAMGGVETCRTHLPRGVRIGKDYGSNKRATVTTEERDMCVIYVSVTSENISAQLIVRDFCRAVGGSIKGVRR